jgi:hypothetical protein
MKMLRKQNANLEDEKETIEHHVTALETEVASLTLDVRERERLRRPQAIHGDNYSTTNPLR